MSDGIRNSGPAVTIHGATLPAPDYRDTRIAELTAKLAQSEADNANMRQALRYAETIMSDAAEAIGTRFTTDDNGVVLPTKHTASTLLALVLALNNGIGKCNAALLGRTE